jgi:uncharacterized protein
MRWTANALAPFLIAICVLAACGAPQTSEAPDEPPAYLAQTPPPMPEGAETVAFAREEANAPVADSPAEETPAEVEPAEGSGETKYWGIEPGEPLPLMWEDLMPDGAEAAFLHQQEQFYAMLKQRYAANTTTLADATPLEEIEEGSELDYMPQLGTFDVVEDLNGELIKIPGYVVPFDFDADQRQSEFLFVPYMGACIHTPPPPPNQIIFVRADPAIQIRDIWAPYWLEGELSTEEHRNGLGDAAYALRLDQLEPYPAP